MRVYLCSLHSSPLAYSPTLGLLPLSPSLAGAPPPWNQKSQQLPESKSVSSSSLHCFITHDVSIPDRPLLRRLSHMLSLALLSLPRAEGKLRRRGEETCQGQAQPEDAGLGVLWDCEATRPPVPYGPGSEDVYLTLWTGFSLFLLSTGSS